MQVYVYMYVCEYVCMCVISRYMYMYMYLCLCVQCYRAVTSQLVLQTTFPKENQPINMVRVVSLHQLVLNQTTFCTGGRYMHLWNGQVCNMDN